MALPHPHRVLVLGNIRSEGLDILNSFAEVIVLPAPAAKDDILAHVGAADAILHKVGKIDRDVLARQRGLRIIARHGVGLDDLDLDAIREHGIALSTTPDANADAVAEATIGMTIALRRRLIDADAMVKHDRQWARENLMGRQLKGAIVGVVGYGRIGRRVAELFRAFGAEIVVSDPALPSEADIPWRRMELDALLPIADVVSLHCPLTAETRHLIDARRLRLMKSDAVLVNTARGGLIDKVALAEAVAAGVVAGAALDVFDPEPPNFDDAVFQLGTILATPHVAAMTLETQTAMAVTAANEIRRVLLENLPPHNNVLG